MERITLIAASSPAIVTEESALGLSQPFPLLCPEILNLPYCCVYIINILELELTLRLCAESEAVTMLYILKAFFRFKTQL